MPTYNFGRFLKETVDSIIPQLSEDIELVILDGGSTDDTPQIASAYAKTHPNIFYHRREKKGGIDRDLALSVSLAKGRYVWLFSSDDVMQPAAIERIRRELEEPCDVYLCGMTICGLDISQRYWEHPVFACKESTTFDWGNPEEKRRFFESALTTTAFFSFMGSLIIDKRRWDERDIEEEFYKSCWGHVARIFQMQEKGLKVRYIKESMLLKRGFNDSFLDRGIVNRFAITVDGYHRLAEVFFGKQSKEAFHIRRTVRAELPLSQVLVVGKSQLQSKEEKQRLDALVRKLYGDRSWSNDLRKALYFAIPAAALRSLALVYKYRRFFKHLRLQRIKHFFSASLRILIAGYWPFMQDGYYF